MTVNENKKKYRLQKAKNNIIIGFVCHFFEKLSVFVILNISHMHPNEKPKAKIFPNIGITLPQSMYIKAKV